MALNAHDRDNPHARRGGSAWRTSTWSASGSTRARRSCPASPSSPTAASPATSACSATGSTTRILETEAEEAEVVEAVGTPRPSGAGGHRICARPERPQPSSTLIALARSKLTWPAIGGRFGERLLVAPRHVLQQPAVDLRPHRARVALVGAVRGCASRRLEVDLHVHSRGDVERAKGEARSRGRSSGSVDSAITVPAEHGDDGGGRRARGGRRRGGTGRAGSPPGTPLVLDVPLGRRLSPVQRRRSPSSHAASGCGELIRPQGVKGDLAVADHQTIQYEGVALERAVRARLGRRQQRLGRCRRVARTRPA